MIDSGKKSDGVQKAMTEQVFDAYMNENYTEKESGWIRAINKLEKKGDGLECIIYQKKPPGQNVNLIRSDYKLKGVTVEQYRGLMDDVDKLKSDKSIKDFQLIENKPAEGKKVYFMEMKMPLMTNRTALVDVEFINKDDGKALLMLS